MKSKKILICIAIHGLDKLARKDKTEISLAHADLPKLKSLRKFLVSPCHARLSAHPSFLRESARERKTALASFSAA